MVKGLGRLASTQDLPVIRRCLFSPTQVSAREPRIYVHQPLLAHYLDDHVGSHTRTIPEGELCMLHAPAPWFSWWAGSLAVRFSLTSKDTQLVSVFSTALEFPGDKGPGVSKETSLPRTNQIHPCLILVQMA